MRKLDPYSTVDFNGIGSDNVRKLPDHYDVGAILRSNCGEPIAIIHRGQYKDGNEEYIHGLWLRSVIDGNLAESATIGCNFNRNVPLYPEKAITPQLRALTAAAVLLYRPDMSSGELWAILRPIALELEGAN